MKLKSFGCSFIYGSDLSDCPHTTDPKSIRHSELTWPALIAKKHGMEYSCHARPAAGNLQILETVLSNITDGEIDFYMINWSWIDRFSYLSEKYQSKDCYWNPLGWNNILPTDDDQVSTIYYRHLHSELRDKLETLIYIKTAIDTLIQTKQLFIMTCIDDSIWNTQWHTTPAILNLQKYTSRYIHDFHGKTFLDWSRENQFEISDKWHPLDQAHEAASRYFSGKVESLLDKYHDDRKTA